MYQGAHVQNWGNFRPYGFLYFSVLVYCDEPLSPLHLLRDMPVGHWFGPWSSGWRIFFMRWLALLGNFPDRCAIPKEGTFSHQEIHSIGIATALNSIMAHLVFLIVFYFVISLLVACGTVCFRKIKQLTVRAKVRSESIIELKRPYYSAQSIGRHRYNQIPSANVEWNLRNAVCSHSGINNHFRIAR